MNSMIFKFSKHYPYNLPIEDKALESNPLKYSTNLERI